MPFSPHIPTEARSDTSLDRRMVAAARFTLSFGALLIVLLDPSEPDRYVWETYTFLVLYSLYGLYVLVAEVRGKGLPRRIAENAWWIDTAAYLLLISLSSGTNSIFFFFFFFAVLTASFARGFETGLAVAFVSAAGFFILGLATTPESQNFDLGRYLVRPMSLIVIGYMMSYWGGYERRSRGRLQLLQRIGAVSNPRFGIDRTVSLNLELIRSFFAADGVLLIFQADEPGKLRVHYSRGGESVHHPSTLDDASPFARNLLSPPPETGAILQRTRFPFPGSPRGYGYDCYDFHAKEFVNGHREAHSQVLDSLDAASMLTVPVFYRERAIGRIFVYGSRPDLFTQSDIPFLSQAVDHFVPIIENIRLVDSMASDAADQERKRIARDIHDSIIQPYVGLQIGIESLSQFVAAANGGGIDPQAVAERIGRLEEIARQGLDDLRNYVHGLNDPAASGPALIGSLERFFAKFTFATGISVRLEHEQGSRIGDRLAAEVFQIVIEGLSNIRRHTPAHRAGVKILTTAAACTVEISNEGADGDFRPRSISKRAESLGGECDVSSKDGITTVRVSIPL